VLQLRLKLGTYQMSHTSEHSHPAWEVLWTNHQSVIYDSNNEEQLAR
jgi:hypothetical protein